MVFLLIVGCNLRGGRIGIDGLQDVAVQPLGVCLSHPRDSAKSSTNVYWYGREIA